MLKFRVVVLVVLFLSLLASPALAKERTTINIRADTGEGNLGFEFEYELSSRLSISGGIGLTVLETVNRGTLDLGFKYYLRELGNRFYLKVRGVTKFEDTTITRFRVGLGVGYTTNFDDKRASIEIGFLIWGSNSSLEAKPSLGIAVGISR